MFSLLKLLIYEPLLFALVGWSARPRLEPSRAIGTLEPFLGHLALGWVATLVLYICLLFEGLMFSPLGTVFPLSIVYTV